MDTIQSKVDELINQMTPSEKAGQLTQYFYFRLPAGAAPILDFDAEEQPRMVESALREGRAGSLLFVTDPAEINRLQRLAVEGNRLGIPLLFGFDVIHGLRTILPVPPPVSRFPQQIDDDRLAIFGSIDSLCICARSVTVGGRTRTENVMTLVDCGLRIHGFHVDDVAVVVVEGEVDMAAAPLLRAAFDTLGPEEHVYVDCAGVGFVDSEGLAALCEVAQRNVTSGGPLHVRASTALRHSVEMSGVGHLFALD